MARKVLFICILFSMFSAAWADRGGFVMRSRTEKENISIYDAGQKAIICWYKGKEMLILSTDKYSSKEAKVLEFMPIPSEPTRVEKMDEKCFEGVARIITAHRPEIPEVTSSHRGASSKADNAMRAPAAEPAVQIVFHKKIDSHDISVGKVMRMDGFVDWVKKFYVKQGMQYNEADVQKLQPMVEDYVGRGYGYFVFDVIELSTEKKSIAPILYEFKSPSVYFPLLVTTLEEGETNVALYLFTPFKTDIWGTRTGLVSGYYAVNGVVDYNNPIKFSVLQNEMISVSAKICEFFKGYEKNVWFSTAKFRGPTKKLTRDFILKGSVSVHGRGFE